MNECTEANTVLEAFCQMIPEYYYLLEFCNVWSEFLGMRIHQILSSFMNLMKDITPACLLGQNEFHVSIHCCRKETYGIRTIAS